MIGHATVSSTAVEIWKTFREGEKIFAMFSYLLGTRTRKCTSLYTTFNVTTIFDVDSRVVFNRIPLLESQESFVLSVVV